MDVVRHSPVRQRLLDAAYLIISSKGFDACNIADIVNAAEVGVGSFYNHFATKEELARAVFAYRIEEFGSELEHMAVGARDAAAATCLVYRSSIERAVQDRAWAAFILQLEPPFQMFDRLMRPHSRVGMQIGIDNGTLSIPDLETAITAKNAAMLAVVQNMLAGRLSRKRAHQSSMYILRMFGVPEDHAQQLSTMSMSALRQAVKASQQ